ncbi:MAG: hypothetical protein WCO05_01450 [Candidatus Moraniibacteriota bacterium]
MATKKTVKRYFLFLGILVVVFLPFEISRLYSKADVQDVMEAVLEFQSSEENLKALFDEEQKLTQELADLSRKTEPTNSVEIKANEFAHDPAVAPGKVRAKILLEDDIVPNFTVLVEYVGVGEKKFETEIDESGEAKIELTSGRYYGEVLSKDGGYRLKGDGPAFFLNANEEKNLGTFYLVKK